MGTIFTTSIRCHIIDHLRCSHCFRSLAWKQCKQYRPVLMIKRKTVVAMSMIYMAFTAVSSLTLVSFVINTRIVRYTRFFLEYICSQAGVLDTHNWWSQSIYGSLWKSMWSTNELLLLFQEKTKHCHVDASASLRVQ